MIQKELSRLKRRELLQLLLAQVKESEEFRRSMEEAQEKQRETEEIYERLKKRLNSKDAQLHKLQNRLNNKDEKIRALRTELEKVRGDRKLKVGKSGSIAEAALQLSGIFEAAQTAADLYLENIRSMGSHSSPVATEEIYKEDA